MIVKVIIFLSFVAPFFHHFSINFHHFFGIIFSIDLSLKINENPRFPWISIANEWKSMVSIDIFRWKQRNTTTSIDFQWKSVKIRRFHWCFFENQLQSMIPIGFSLTINESPCLPLIFHCKSMKIHVFIDFPLIICGKRRCHAAGHTKRYV